MTTLQYEIRPMRSSEVNQLVASMQANPWAREMSEDFFSDWHAMEGTHSMVAVAPDGKVIGHCGCTATGNTRRMMCLYIVDEPYRHQGIGTKLFAAARQAASSTPGGVTGLITLAPTIPMYESAGFKHTVCIFAPYIGIPRDMDTLPNYTGNPIRVVSHTDVGLEKIKSYDQKMCKINRESFLKMLCQKHKTTFVALQQGEVVGFGHIQPHMYDLHQLGPLYADSDVIAAELLRAVVQSIQAGARILSHIPVNNANAIRLLGMIGLTEGRYEGDAYILTTDKIDEPPIDNVYSIGSNIYMMI